jgi:hypothetical protein
MYEGSSLPKLFSFGEVLPSLSHLKPDIPELKLAIQRNLCNRRSHDDRILATASSARDLAPILLRSAG